MPVFEYLSPDSNIYISIYIRSPGVLLSFCSFLNVATLIYRIGYIYILYIYIYTAAVAAAFDHKPNMWYVRDSSI